jgi:hypothetical protein
MLKSWKPSMGVLTRDGFLHLLPLETDDLATHPDVLHAVFRCVMPRFSCLSTPPRRCLGLLS